MFLLEDIEISFRNPVKFVNQWYTKKDRIRAIFIWLFWLWHRNDCDIWIKYGVRIIGIEIGYTQYIKRRNKVEKWRRTCPVCERTNTRPDYDYPVSMQNCKDCGSEWNKYDINFNARKDV